MDEEPWLGAEVLLPRNEEAEWCNDCHQYRLNLRGTEKFEARNLPDNRKALRRLDRQKRLHSGNPQGQLGCLGFSEPGWLRLTGFLTTHINNANFIYLVARLFSLVASQPRRLRPIRCWRGF